MPVTSRVTTRFFLYRCFVGPMEIHVGPLWQQSFEKYLLGQVTVKAASIFGHSCPLLSLSLQRTSTLYSVGFFFRWQCLMKTWQMDGSQLETIIRGEERKTSVLVERKTYIIIRTNKMSSMSTTKSYVHAWTCIYTVHACIGYIFFCTGRGALWLSMACAIPGPANKSYHRATIYYCILLCRSYLEFSVSSATVLLERWT
jgi:hypothetical protein